MFEEFKLNTITKDEFLSGIEDKADKEEIANIVSIPLCIQNWPSCLSQKIVSDFQPGLDCKHESMWTVFWAKMSDRSKWTVFQNCRTH